MDYIAPHYTDCHVIVRGLPLDVRSVSRRTEVVEHPTLSSRLARTVQRLSAELTFHVEIAYSTDSWYGTLVQAATATLGRYAVHMSASRTERTFAVRFCNLVTWNPGFTCVALSQLGVVHGVS